MSPNGTPNSNVSKYDPPLRGRGPSHLPWMFTLFSWDAVGIGGSGRHFPNLSQRRPRGWGGVGSYRSARRKQGLGWGQGLRLSLGLSLGLILGLWSVLGLGLGLSMSLALGSVQVHRWNESIEGQVLAGRGVSQIPHILPRRPDNNRRTFVWLIM